MSPLPRRFRLALSVRKPAERAWRAQRVPPRRDGREKRGHPIPRAGRAGASRGTPHAVRRGREAAKGEQC
eukprot:9930465-Alexandrium_andersonii.AAC.1